MGFDDFLRGAASLLGLQWRAFKRRGIKRKVERRITQVGLPNFEEYLSRIKSDPAERVHLSEILTVTISRFFRDKAVFDTLETSVLPKILENREKGDLKIWSIGCASGEEPYSLSLLWKEKFEDDHPGFRLSLFATDIDDRMIERAREGRYRESSLREVSQETRLRFFQRDEGFYVLHPDVRKGVRFIRHDLLNEEPLLEMDLVFCRNLAFTYFSRESQVKVMEKIAFSLTPKGFLVIGKDEGLPPVYPTLFVPVFPAERVYEKFNIPLLT